MNSKTFASLFLIALASVFATASAQTDGPFVAGTPPPDPLPEGGQGGNIIQINPGDLTCEGILDFDQSQVGFAVVGAEAGNAIVDFFRRDGSNIDTFTLPNLDNLVYAFERVGGVEDIAGFSIYNDDPAGIGFDDICFNVTEPTPTESHTWGRIKTIYE
jgi:hypothetical protein